MKLWQSVGIVAIAMAIGTVMYFSPSVAEEGKSVEQMITTAKTPADHEALAAYYEKEAQDTHKKHAEHQKMGEWYKKNPTVNKSGFSVHCDLIAANYQKTAKEYEDLAKLHKEMAKQSK